MNASHRVLPLLLVLLQVSIPGCSEDEPTGTTHFYDPVWSPDGNTVVAGITDLPVGATVNGTPAPTLAVYDVASRQSAVRTFASILPRSRRWFDRSGTVLAFPVNGLTFYSPSGEVLGSHTLPPNPVVHFSADSSAYLWAVHDNGRSKIGRVVYTDKPWQPVRETLLHDSVTSASVLDIVHTGKSSYAVQFSDGTVVEYALGGGHISRYSLPPLRSDDPWRHQIRYYDDGATRRLYVLTDSGLTSLDLNARTPKTIILGSVLNFDVSSATRFLVFETTVHHVWLALPDGIPLSRLAVQNTMPRLSPDGKFLASVEVVDSRRDSLTVMKFSR